MGVRWTRYDPDEQRPDHAAEDVARAFEARIAGFLRLGWRLVDRQDDPLQARLVYWQRRPTAITDTAERLLWVDETGTIRSRSVAPESLADDASGTPIEWRPIVLRQMIAFGFTPLERRIALELLRAQSNAEIAATMDLAVRTVTNYLSDMMRKSHTHNRVGLVLALLQVSVDDEHQLAGS